MSEGFGCQCDVFPNAHLVLQGLCPPPPKRTPQEVVMDLEVRELPLFKTDGGDATYEIALGTSRQLPLTMDFLLGRHWISGSA